jgi:hypothetical protein
MEFLSEGRGSVPIMPKLKHEGLVKMFRERPAMAGDLLGGPLRISVPEFDSARVSSSDLTDLAPTEYRADAVITLETARHPVMAVVVEVQLRQDPDKRYTWPVYLTSLHARLRCPVVLLVVCSGSAVARWCSVPIKIGEPNLVITPVVLGPEQVPVVTDPELGRRMPELVVLSTVTHCDSWEDPRPYFDLLFASLSSLDSDLANQYNDYVLASLSTAARQHLEEYMTTTEHPFQSDFARRYYDEGQVNGEVKGEAKALLLILEARGVDVPEPTRARITECTDRDQVESWLRHAVTAVKIEDLKIE